ASTPGAGPPRGPAHTAPGRYPAADAPVTPSRLGDTSPARGAAPAPAAGPDRPGIRPWRCRSSAGLRAPVPAACRPSARRAPRPVRGSCVPGWPPAPGAARAPVPRHSPARGVAPATSARSAAAPPGALAPLAPGPAAPMLLTRAGTCSDSQTSRRLRTNIVLTLLTFGENIAPVVLTISENVLTFG